MPSARSYTYVTRRRGDTFEPSGALTIAVANDGARVSAYETSDDGERTTTKARVRVLADGTLAGLEVERRDADGAAVSERFVREDTGSRWTTFADEGSAAPSAAAFYAPLIDVPDAVFALVEVLRKVARVPLLPDGEAWLEREGTLSLVSRQGVARRVSAYALHGLDRSPQHVWVEDAGAVFARLDSWSGVVAAGWEPSVAELVAAQQRFEADRDAATAHRSGRRPRGAFAFTHARVFDAERKRWRADHTVVVRRGIIEAVGPSATTKLPPDTEVTDVGGRSLLPGLWDMHAHLEPWQARSYVAAGVTTIRDLHNDPDMLDAARDRFNAGEAVGPSILRGGFIGGGPPSTGDVTADTEEQARAAVDYYAGRGWEQIKIFNGVKPELVPVLAREAHARGLRVSGHVPASMRAADAVRAGFDEVNHLIMLLPDFVPEIPADVRLPAGFLPFAERIARLDPASPPARATIGILRAHGTVVDPTLTSFEDLLRHRRGELPPSARASAERPLPAVERKLRAEGRVVHRDQAASEEAAFAAAKALVARLHASGVQLVLGTDGFRPGDALHHELELYVEAGIPRVEVIALATIGSARVMKRDGEVGTIAPGKQADLVLVDGDPGAHIEDLRRVVTVVRRGTVYDGAVLREAATFTASGLPAR